MTSLLNALNTGKTSILSNQKATEIIGNNIANVNTEGYSRQIAELGRIPSISFGNFFVGQGVTVTDIYRQYSSFINRQLQEKNIEYGDEMGRANSLTELERVFSVSKDTVASKINEFFDAWQGLSANPNNQAERDLVVQQGQQLGEAFAKVNQELDTITRNMNTEILGTVESLNEKIAAVAELNARINLVETSGQSANAARDQRDVLVRDLSRSLGVQTYTDNRGMLCVQLPGGLPLVEGTDAMTIGTEVVGSNVNLKLNVLGHSLDIHLDNLGGSMHGMLEMRDVFIGGLRQDMDTLAVELTQSVNDLHVQGYYLDPATGTPVPGQNFFNDLAGPPPVENASRHIEMAFTDGNLIAAAGQNNAAAGDNETALKIGQLEVTHKITGTDDNFDAFFSKTVARVGIEASRNNLARSGAQDAIIQMENLRESYSGVSLEEEIIDLIRFQRGFESSAKYLSTVDELMDSLLQMR